MKWRFVIPALVFAALFSVFGITLYRAEQGDYNPGEIKSPLIGKAAPQFRLPQVEDPAKFVDSTAFAGKPYVVNVWATWCVECRHEHAVLLDIARQGMVAIIGLDTKDELTDAQRWLSALGNPYTATAADTDGRAALDWGVYGAPETFLVDARGIVVYKHVGALTAAVWQERFLPLLQSGGANGTGAGGGS